MRRTWSTTSHLAITSFLLLALIACLDLLGLIVNLAYAQQSKAEQNLYVVDGLALGGMVHVESAIYKANDCAPSTQFQDLTFCQRKKSDNSNRGRISSTTSILHERDGTARYVNRFIEPAFLSANDAEDEIARLSTRFSQKPQIINIPKKPGAPNGRIAIWGTLRLKELDQADMAIARAGRSPEKGILVDFVGDYSHSAQQDLPVYTVEGGTGFVWIVSFDDNGRGRLRFFTIDAARLSSVRLDKNRIAQSQPKVNQPTAISRADQEAKDRIIAKMRQAERTAVETMENCEPTCPDNPEAGKLRQDMLDGLEQENLAADDAAKFVAALGSEEALTAYVSSCATKKCGFINEATKERDALRRSRDFKVVADSEEREFNRARGSAPALKKYVADCQVCAFAKAALDEIDRASANDQLGLFTLRICNEDFLAVDVAIVGRRDPNVNLWTAQGWWHFEPNECANIGSFARGKVYYHAYNRLGTWGKDKIFCTSQEKFLTAVVGGDCLEGEKDRTFYEKEILNDDTIKLPAHSMTYSALAISGNRDIVWGGSWRQSSQGDAERVALRQCNRDDCRVVRAISDDDCLILASGRYDGGGKYLYHYVGSEHDEGRNAARAACSRETGSACYIAMDSCAAH